MRVYPNPTGGVFVVEIEGVAGVASLEVTDIRGRIIANRAMLTDKLEIDLSHEPGGVYLLVLQTQAWQVVKRVVVY